MHNHCVVSVCIQASQQLLTQPTQNCQTFTTKFGSVVRRRAGKRRGLVVHGEDEEGEGEEEEEENEKGEEE